MTGAEGGPVWVKGKVGVRYVGGCVHTLFAGPSSAGLPGIWKERSGKSTPWSEWYIWKKKNRERKDVIGGGKYRHQSSHAHIPLADLRLHGHKNHVERESRK